MHIMYIYNNNCFHELPFIVCFFMPSFLTCMPVAKSCLLFLELQKFIGALFFAWDLKMYHEVRIIPNINPKIK